MKGGVIGLDSERKLGWKEIKMDEEVIEEVKGLKGVETDSGKNGEDRDIKRETERKEYEYKMLKVGKNEKKHEAGRRVTLRDV